jgi:hypothetical protein
LPAAEVEQTRLRNVQAIATQSITMFGSFRNLSRKTRSEMAVSSAAASFGAVLMKF